MKAALIAALVAAIVSATAATAAGTGLITGVQIKNGSIGLVDLSAAAKRALKGQRGPAGPAGAQGVPGGFDPAKLSYVQNTTVSIAPNTGTEQRTYCPADSRAISGGWVVITGSVGEVFVNRSYDNGASWTINVWNHSQYTNADITPFVVCAAR
jgi:hypothetical protein